MQTHYIPASILFSFALTSRISLLEKKEIHSYTITILVVYITMIKDTTFWELDVHKLLRNVYKEFKISFKSLSPTKKSWLINTLKTSDESYSS